MVLIVINIGQQVGGMIEDKETKGMHGMINQDGDKLIK
jgi:hypothetical protein